MSYHLPRGEVKNVDGIYEIYVLKTHIYIYFDCAIVHHLKPFPHCHFCGRAPVYGDSNMSFGLL